jgi:transposase
MGKSIRNFSTVTRVGLDLAKRVFQVHAVGAKGEIVMARKLTRSQLIPFFAALPPCVVAMEACSSAHHWGRALIELGHEVRLLPPAHVNPYVRRNKNDAVDAAAIYEAAGRPGQRFVPVRSIDNQAEPMRHRTRELLAGQRTAALNALRGHLAEIGVVAPQGVQHAYGLKRLAGAGFDEKGEVVVPDCVRVGLRPLISQIDALDEVIGALDREIAASVRSDATAKRLITIPGVGPVTASGDRGHDPGRRRLRQRARVRRLPRLDAAPELDRRQNAARAHHQDGRPLPAQASGHRRLRDASSSPRP